MEMRNTKRWKELYNDKLLRLVDKDGTSIKSYETKETVITAGLIWPFSLLDDPWTITLPDLDKPIITDLMDSHIKTAEEYADKLYQSLR